MTDKQGKNADALLYKKLFLLDMDGTIYNENRIFDGTLDFLAQIEANGGRYIFITNNSSKSVADYVQKVNSMGIRADASHFYTSSQATAFYLKKHYPGQTVYCMGTRSLVRELSDSGITVVTQVDDRATVVLIGFDTESTSEKIRNTCMMLGRDVAYLATNPDLVCPVSFGYIPDCGSMSIMLKNATGKTPFFIGKPQPVMVECVLQMLGTDATDAVIVGDRLYTDIAAGINAGVDTICVLSGESTLQDIESGNTRPTWIFDSIKEIQKVLAATSPRPGCSTACTVPSSPA